MLITNCVGARFNVIQCNCSTSGAKAYCGTCRVEEADPEALLRASYKQFQMEKSLPQLERQVHQLQVVPLFLCLMPTIKNPSACMDSRRTASCISAQHIYQFQCWLPALTLAFHTSPPQKPRHSSLAETILLQGTSQATYRAKQILQLMQAAWHTCVCSQGRSRTPDLPVLPKILWSHRKAGTVHATY